MRSEEHHPELHRRVQPAPVDARVLVVLDAGHPARDAVARRTGREQVPAAARALARDLDRGLHEIVPGEAQRRLEEALADRLAPAAEAEARAAVPDRVLAEELRDLAGDRLDLAATDRGRSARRRAPRSAPSAGGS